MQQETPERWLEGTGRTSQRAVLYGALAWGIFCIIAVAIRGIRWDEEYEMAQNLLGAVQYPEGHPFVRCARNALNLQIYVTSALLWLSSSASVVCGFRNVLMLAATILPVYLFASFLGRKALWGHVAVCFVLMGLSEAFFGCYRFWAWPQFFSTGHVGRGYAFIVLYLFVTRRWRSGFFLLALMPCVHIGQMPIVLMFACVLICAAFASPDTSLLRKALPWTIPGMAICAMLWKSRGLFSVSIPTQGAYYSDLDPYEVWRGFLPLDVHRAAVGGVVKYANSFFVLAAFLLLCAAAALSAAPARQWRARLRTPWGELFTYGFLVALSVWGIMAVHLSLGNGMPYVLTAWIPYRFTNHAAVLIVPLLVAVLSGPDDANTGRVWAGRFFLLAGLAYAPLLMLLSRIVPDHIYTRYLASGEGLLFVLCGATFVFLLVRIPSTRSRWCWGIACLAGWAILVFYHQFGAFCLVLGLLGAVFLTIAGARLAPVLPPARRSLDRVAVLLCLVAVVTLTFQQWQGRCSLPRWDFDRALERTLAERATPMP